MSENNRQHTQSQRFLERAHWSCAGELAEFAKLQVHDFLLAAEIVLRCTRFVALQIANGHQVESQAAAYAALKNTVATACASFVFHEALAEERNSYQTDCKLNDQQHSTWSIR